MQKNIIKAALFTPVSGGRWGLPVLMWAGPGVAKTSVIEDVAAQYALPCETLSPSERGEGAFGVVPVPESFGEGKDKVTLLTYPAPDWSRKFTALGRGVVFVDEVTSAAPALQPPLMGLFLARRIGGYTLPKGVRVMAAANPPELAASGYDLPMPLANRMGHIDWEGPTVEEHTQFMLRGASSNDGLRRLINEMDEDRGLEVADDAEELAYDATGEEARVLKAWPDAWARAVGLETAFLQAKTDAKNRQPRVGDPAGTRAWPSDRTWEMATRAYAASIIHKLTESETESFVEAFIGAATATEWFAFVRANDLPNAAHLLDGKVQFKHEARRVDRTVAVLQSCVALVAPRQAILRDKRAAALWEIIHQLTTDEADLDLLVPTAQALVECDLYAMKSCAKVLTKLNPILKAAKIQQGAR